jgi:sugar phosphate isomerase/epimerase
MRLGIGSFTFAWAVGVPGHKPKQPMSALALLDIARQLKVRVVQLCDNLPLARLSGPELEAFGTAARDLQLQIELGARGLDPDNLRAYLGLARRFGCPFLRLVIDSPGDEPSADETVTRLRSWRPEFEAAGVKLAIENHDRFRSDTLASVIEQLGPDWAGICLDTVNSFGALEGPEVVVQRLGEFTLCLHVKDFVVRRVSHQMGFLLEGCPAGQGRLDVPWLLAQLAHCPHEFNAILETWVSPLDSLDQTIARERSWAEQGVHYLRTLIKD